MPRLTRNSSRSTNGERSDEEQENASSPVSKRGPPNSEMAYERKFIVVRGLSFHYRVEFVVPLLEGTLTNSCLYKVRHPKSGAAVLLRLSEASCDEVSYFLSLFWKRRVFRYWMWVKKWGAGSMGIVWLKMESLNLLFLFILYSLPCLIYSKIRQEAYLLIRGVQNNLR